MSLTARTRKLLAIFEITASLFLFTLVQVRSTTNTVLVPTLHGTVSTQLPIQNYSPEDLNQTVTLAANTHNYVTCSTSSPTIPVVSDMQFSSTVRFWVYEFNGQEPPYNGDFFISEAEIAVDPSLADIDSLTHFTGGNRYYLMLSQDIDFSCNAGLIAPEEPTAICGNGVLETEEECDDGNTNTYDGCSTQCTVETGFSCTGSPSSCQVLIPDLIHTSSNPQDAESSSSTAQSSLSSSSAANTQNTPSANLFVTLSSTPVRERQILAGTLSSPLYRLNLHPDQHDVSIGSFAFASLLGDPQSIDRLELFFPNEATPFAVATRTACENIDFGSASLAHFCMTRDLDHWISIPANSDTEIIVSARLHSEHDGAISGEPVQMILTSISAQDETNKNYLSIGNNDATGAGEIFYGRSTPGPQQNHAVIGKEHIVTLSRIAQIQNGSTDTDGSNIPVGESSIGAFTFTADQNTNDVDGSNIAALDTLIFTVTSSNVAFDATAFQASVKGNESIVADCTPFYLSGDEYTGQSISNGFYVQCHDLEQIGASLSPGQSMTVILKGVVTSPSLNPTTTSSLQVSLEEITTPRTNLAANAEHTSSHIRWIDKDSTKSKEFYWVDQSETTVFSTQYQQ